jgi:hypothetical protein
MGREEVARFSGKEEVARLSGKVRSCMIKWGG